MMLKSEPRQSAGDATVAFRLPIELRDKMFDEAYAEGKYLSEWLRLVCIEKLKQSAAINRPDGADAQPKGLTKPLRLFEKFW
jgi:hypothetical protein